MKIIAGKLKGKTIIAQKSGLRPTTALAKASLFNIIGPDLLGKTFADIFAGTGAVGFEAFSRGAKEVAFVELNPEAVRLLKKNIANLDVDAKVFKRNALDFLGYARAQYDYIFLSPPFDTIHWHKLLRCIEQSPLLTEENTVIVQHPKTINIESFILDKVDERKYGFNKLTFFKRRKEQ